MPCSIKGKRAEDALNCGKTFRRLWSFSPLYLDKPAGAVRLDKNNIYPAVVGSTYVNGFSVMVVRLKNLCDERFQFARLHLMPIEGMPPQVLREFLRATLWEISLETSGNSRKQHRVLWVHAF